ncbi:unnamed protein product [Adineta steineri]|uniref:Opioid growth factor receptor (OGFr) conserved domain-containing protein n=1 Tax=Adineta steineri TaxID=433720 RepID=A0A815UHU3_9BILA|nr:unnamed protein product [Adineta steineri]CAF1650857.1 unnamed protein product [Adineta steineri]
MGDINSNGNIGESIADTDNIHSDTIPVGDEHKEQEEPSETEASKDSPMGMYCGCGSTKENDANDNDSNKKSIQKTGQSQLQQPSSNDRMDSDEDSHNKSSKKSKTISDDDDDDNNNRGGSGRHTRSSATLSKLRINFEDSGDENEDSRHYSYSKRDIAEYRNHYPNARSNPKIHDNYDFYTNQIRSHPDGDFIDKIHKNWFGDHRKLEYHHGYIQWLFPLQERGLNISAEPLQKHEIESISKDEKALERLLKSYKLMLDFYGFKLVDENTGEIRRLSGDSYKSRFRNLDTSSHNYLRITRILKCLGEFKYEYLKFSFLEAILRESITENKLSNCLRSCKDYWIETLRSPDERRAIRQYARELVEYRNKGMTPPKSHKAHRPQPTSVASDKTENRSLSKGDDDDNMDH